MSELQLHQARLFAASLRRDIRNGLKTAERMKSLDVEQWAWTRYFSTVASLVERDCSGLRSVLSELQTGT